MTKGSYSVAQKEINKDIVQGQVKKAICIVNNNNKLRQLLTGNNRLDSTNI